MVEDGIIEGKARINVANESVDEPRKISKQLPVFYNPDMKLNRDISVALLNYLSTFENPFRIALPLAGTGIRGIRFLLETDSVNEIYFNDMSEKAIQNVKDNIKLNVLENDLRIFFSNKDANLFLLESSGFDYIDIDPFGSPNPFLDSAIKRISRNGILSVTATDTAPLCGTYPKTCARKYFAKPLRNELKHEVGLRILIRKVQLIASQYDKALIPIISYWNMHYFRIFFRCVKGKKKVDEIIGKHELYNGCGPMWMGKLFDEEVMDKVKLDNPFFKLLQDEAKVDIPFFYDIHTICKNEKLVIPKKETIIGILNSKGYNVSSTHFSPYGIKCNCSYEEFLFFLKELQ